MQRRGGRGSQRSASTLSGRPHTDLPEFDTPPSDPFEVAHRWLDAADRDGVREPRALTLATADNPYAAGTLYWKETLQQLTFAGVTRRLTDDEADVLFAERPRPAQAVAVYSRPDEPLDDEGTFRGRVQDLAARGEPILRPDTWGGFRLEPENFEFWCGSSDRLHRRLRYVREGGHWRAYRLQP